MRKKKKVFKHILKIKMHGHKLTPKKYKYMKIKKDTLNGSYWLIHNLDRKDLKLKKLKLFMLKILHNFRIKELLNQRLSK